MSAADRQRRYRQRHRDATLYVPVDLPWAAYVALCDAGLIADSCEDKERIAEAIIHYLISGGA